MPGKLIRLFVILAAFLLSALLTGAFLNQGNSDNTSETAPASLSVVHMISWGEELAPLFGLRGEAAERMKPGSYRPGLCVIGTDRGVNFVVDRFGVRIVTMNYELRSRSGERLIERGEVVDTREDGGRLYGSVPLKDLIKEGKEYLFSVILNTSGGADARYTGVILISDGMEVYEKCEFVRRFHQVTLEPERITEISRYLEPDATGDNSSYAKVNIHSGVSQIHWGELAPLEASEPLLTIREISEETAVISLKWTAVMNIEGENSEYNVEEDFRLRYTPERIYLLDYSRTCRRIFTPTAHVYGERTIMLGITEKSAVSMTESEDGNILAFLSENRLFVYNQVTCRMAEVFSQYDNTHSDIRYTHDDYGIRILSLEETGNCLFLVHGYMNRGLHEGEVGMQVWYYDAGVNTVEEQLFVPYYRTPEELAQNMDRLLHLSRAGDLVFILDGTVFKVNLEERKVEPFLPGADLEIAGEQDHIVTSEGEGNHITRLVLTDLMDLSETEVLAENGDYIRALGFMGGDFIYGIARQSDVIAMEESYPRGMAPFPMYEIRIQTPQGALLESYSRPGVFVTGITIEENRILLDRCTIPDEGVVENIDQDLITNAALSAAASNRLESVLTREYETIQEIVLKNEIRSSEFMVLTPKEVLYEGSRVAETDTEFTGERYYACGMRGLVDFYDSPSEALRTALEQGGFAADEEGDYLYQRGNLAQKNQIMAIEAAQGDNSLRVCLETILSLEGGAMDVEAALSSGLVPEEILKQGLPRARVLELSGCPLSAMEYYLDQDIPVLVLSGSRTVLLTGFNEQDYVVMDPQKGTLEKERKTALEEEFTRGGSRYLTYIRKEEA